MRLSSDTTFRRAAPARGVFYLMVCGLLLSMGCGGKTPGGPTPPPPPPPPDELRLSCPSEETLIEAASPGGTELDFDAPAPTGGLAPVTVECSPGPGSLFAIGETTVQCTATAADMVQASCGFTVRVRVSQTLLRTKFLAFGDSITAGTVRLSPLVMLDRPDAYPAKVEQMLKLRYPTQEDILVINEGFGGEVVDRRTSNVPHSGMERLPRVLDAHRPEVLLLQEGTNDLSTARVSAIAGGLRTMVSLARRRDVEVIIANITPVGPPHADSDSRVTKPAAILELNRRIALIPDEFEGVEVVDLYGLFQSDMTLLGPDGLHPTLDGYTRIAEALTDVIVRRYNQQGQSLDSRSRPVRSGLRARVR